MTGCCERGGVAGEQRILCHERLLGPSGERLQRLEARRHSHAWQSCQCRHHGFQEKRRYVVLYHYGPTCAAALPQRCRNAALMCRELRLDSDFGRLAMCDGRVAGALYDERPWLRWRQSSVGLLSRGYRPCLLTHLRTRPSMRRRYRRVACAQYRKKLGESVPRHRCAVMSVEQERGPVAVSMSPEIPAQEARLRAAETVGVPQESCSSCALEVLRYPSGVQRLAWVVEFNTGDSEFGATPL